MDWRSFAFSISATFAVGWAAYWHGCNVGHRDHHTEGD